MAEQGVVATDSPEWKAIQVLKALTDLLQVENQQEKEQRTQQEKASIAWYAERGDEEGGCDFSSFPSLSLEQTTHDNTTTNSSNSSSCQPIVEPCGS